MTPGRVSFEVQWDSVDRCQARDVEAPRSFPHSEMQKLRVMILAILMDLVDNGMDSSPETMDNREYVMQRDGTQTAHEPWPQAPTPPPTSHASFPHAH